MKLENKPVLPIWGQTIPGNTGESKYVDMPVDKSLTMMDVFTKYPGIWDKTTEEIGDLRGNNFMVWDQEIENGYAEETYSDVPLLVPYLAEGSDSCVILCPGGAYLTKSMDSEGAEVAEYLNQAGISAFVLWYRSYPYRAPLMYLDCQRAVRYVRYHAAQYGIDPNKIAAAGFSAGGNLCGVEALCFGDKPVDYPGYEPDEIDRTDGRVNALGLIYPAVSMLDDKITAIIGGLDLYADPVRRNSFAAQYDLRTHVTPDAPPAFLCAAMDDFVVPPPLLAELALSYAKEKVPCELHLFPYGGHGFGACHYHPVGPFPAPDYSAVCQWIDLFINWLKHVYTK